VIQSANGHQDKNGNYICDICNTDLCIDHLEMIIPAVAATCIKTGLTEGKKCARCGDILVAQQITEATGHTEVIDDAVAPTCSATGLTEGKHCSVCGEVMVVQTVVDAMGHTEVIDNAVEATYWTAGLSEGKHCSMCEMVLVKQEVLPKLIPTINEDGTVSLRNLPSGVEQVFAAVYGTNGQMRYCLSDTPDEEFYSICSRRFHHSKQNADAVRLNFLCFQAR